MLKVYTNSHPASHKDSNHSNINMNTICVLKKCIQIDFSEYTLFLNTLVKFEFTYLLTIPSLLGK